MRLSKCCNERITYERDGVPRQYFCSKCGRPMVVEPAGVAPASQRLSNCCSASVTYERDGVPRKYFCTKCTNICGLKSPAPADMIELIRELDRQCIPLIGNEPSIVGICHSVINKQLPAILEAHEKPLLERIEELEKAAEKDSDKLHDDFNKLAELQEALTGLKEFHTDVVTRLLKEKGELEAQLAEANRINEAHQKLNGELQAKLTEAKKLMLTEDEVGSCTYALEKCAFIPGTIASDITVPPILAKLATQSKSLESKQDGHGG